MREKQVEISSARKGSETSLVGDAKNFPENLPQHWRAHLAAEKDQAYFKKLSTFLLSEHKKNRQIFPPRSQVLRALQSVDLPDVKVVILGQDPYHGEGQAIGLSFAVPQTLLPKPPSLLNIFKEIASDLKTEMDPKASDLSGWAGQGVLLLNTVLTVRRSEALSHRGVGWEIFTDRVIQILNDRIDPVVFLLWGSAAQRKKEFIGAHHFILESAHPSPLSAFRGFFGSKHFSKANEILLKLGKTPIDWKKTQL